MCIVTAAVFGIFWWDYKNVITVLLNILNLSNAAKYFTRNFKNSVLDFVYYELRLSHLAVRQKKFRDLEWFSCHLLRCRP